MSKETSLTLVENSGPDRPVMQLVPITVKRKMRL